FSYSTLPSCNVSVSVGCVSGVCPGLEILEHAEFQTPTRSTTITYLGSLTNAWNETTRNIWALEKNIRVNL
ncbi:unnamed protein product, partial [Allacma fusca]